MIILSTVILSTIKLLSLKRFLNNVLGTDCILPLKPKHIMSAKGPYRRFTTVPILSLIDCLLVWDTRMCMFYLSRPIESADSMADCSADSYRTCIYQFLTQMGDLLEIVGMGL